MNPSLIPMPSESKKRKESRKNVDSNKKIKQFASSNNLLSSIQNENIINQSSTFNPFTPGKSKYNQIQQRITNTISNSKSLKERNPLQQRNENQKSKSKLSQEKRDTTLNSKLKFFKENWKNILRKMLYSKKI